MAATTLIDAATVLTTASCAVETWEPDDEQAVTFVVECTQVHSVRFYVSDSDFTAITSAAILADETRTGVAATTGTDGNAYIVDPGAKSYIACVVTNDSASSSTVTVTAENPSDPAMLFTVAEARAFDKGQLASVSDYPHDDIVAKEVEIREWLEKVCGVNFVRTTYTAELYDGDGSDYLVLKWPKVSSITAIAVDGTAFDATDLSTTDYSSGLAIDSDKGIITRRAGIFDAGWSNVAVTYVAGYEYVPDLVKRAALMIAVTELPATNVPFAADDYDAGGVSVSFGRGDGFNGNWHRIPEVVKAIRMYSMKLPGVA